MIQIFPVLKLHNHALAAWRRGHRISLGDSRPGFEFPQGVRFLGKNIAMLSCVFEFKCIVCVLKKRNKGIGPKIFKKPT
jgi:hypothetical protein